MSSRTKVLRSETNLTADGVFDLGLVDRLPKPIDFERLMQAIVG